MPSRPSRPSFQLNGQWFVQALKAVYLPPVKLFNSFLIMNNPSFLSLKRSLWFYIRLKSVNEFLCRLSTENLHSLPIRDMMRTGIMHTYVLQSTWYVNHNLGWDIVKIYFVEKIHNLLKMKKGNSGVIMVCIFPLSVIKWTATEPSVFMSILVCSEHFFFVGLTNSYR